MIKVAIALGILVSAAVLMKKKDMSYRQSILKSIYPMIMWSTNSNGKRQLLENKNGATPSMSFYDLTMNAIDGTPFNFSNLKGKKILIDGQQRVTALTAAILGEYVIDKTYKRVKISIRFK